MGSIFADVRLRTSGLTADAAEAKGILAGVNADVSKNAIGLGVAGLAVGAVLIGVAAKAVGMATQFQEGMTTIVTGAGEAKSNLAMVSQGVLKIADDTGTTTQQLTAGLYQIESAGFHGAAGLDVLSKSAMGAKVGNADLGVVANGVTTEMVDFASKHLTAAQAVNTMIATVANGKTTMQEYASSLSTVLPTASAVGVSLLDTSAAMATMTGEGVPAAQAATFLRQTLMALTVPTAGAAKALEGVGLTTKQVSDEMKVSLPATLQMITDAVGKKFPVGSAAYVEALKQISGGTKTMQGMLDLTGDHLQTFKNNVDNIGTAVKNGGDQIQGWALVQEDFNFKLSRAAEVVQTFMIQLGTALLPVLSQLVDIFTNNIAPVLISFVTLLGTNHAALAALAAVVGGVVVASLYALASAAWAMVAPFLIMIAPFAAAAAGLALLTVGLVAAYNNSKIFRDIVNEIVTVVMKVAGVIGASLASAVGAAATAFHSAQPALAQLGQALSQLGIAIQPILPLLGYLAAGIGGLLAVAIGIAIGVIGGLIGAFRGIIMIVSGVVQVIIGLVGLAIDMLSGPSGWGKLPGDIANIWNGVQTIIFGAGTAIIGFISGFISAFIGFFQHLYDVLVGHSIIPDMVNGIVSWIEQLPGRVLGIIGGLVSSFIGLIAGLASQVISQASQIMSGFAGAISAGIGAVLGAIGSLKNGILGVFAGAASWLVSAGGQIIGGLISGISGAVGGAISKVTGAVGSIISAATGALGIKSPSTVFAEIGDNTMLGLAQGIDRTANTATTSAKNATSSLINAVSGSADLSIGSAGLSAGNAKSSDNGGNVFNITVQVTTDQSDGGTPEAVGQRFGISLGDQLATTLQQRGHSG